MPNVVGQNGQCYAPCPDGYEGVSENTCAKKCPSGFAATDSACLRPVSQRETQPFLRCPAGAQRQFDVCMLGCPNASIIQEVFDMCVPSCPPGFTSSDDGLSCQSEFQRRSATLREACFANEDRLGNMCLSPCQAGMEALPSDKELCYRKLPDTLRAYFWNGGSDAESSAIVSKLIFPRQKVLATCSQGYSNVNGKCYADCPSNAEAVSTTCVVSCPKDFRTSPNRTACLRPTVVRVDTGRAPESRLTIVYKVGIVFGVIIVLAFLTAALRRRRSA